MKAFRQKRSVRDQIVLIGIRHFETSILQSPSQTVAPYKRGLHRRHHAKVIRTTLVSAFLYRQFGSCTRFFDSVGQILHTYIVRKYILQLHLLGSPFYLFLKRQIVSVASQSQGEARMNASCLENTFSFKYMWFLFIQCVCFNLTLCGPCMFKSM